MDLALVIIGTVAAVASAVAAFLAWRAAMKANDTARRMESIEHARRREELTPDFDIGCTVPASAQDDSGLLSVALKPGALDVVDDVVITILDEAGIDHWGRGLPQGVSQERADAFVWGGLEFDTGASAQVSSNRATKPRQYTLGNGKNWDRLSLSRTRPGGWMSATSPDEWRKRYNRKPVRLLITCRHPGFEPWTILREVVPEVTGGLPVRMFVP